MQFNDKNWLGWVRIDQLPLKEAFVDFYGCFILTANAVSVFVLQQCGHKLIFDQILQLALSDINTISYLTNFPSVYKSMVCHYHLLLLQPILLVCVCACARLLSTPIWLPWNQHTKWRTIYIYTAKYVQGISIMCCDMRSPKHDQAVWSISLAEWNPSPVGTPKMSNNSPYHWMLGLRTQPLFERLPESAGLQDLPWYLTQRFQST